MNTVPVGVIIPCYNCSATIDRAVASVANQSARPAEVVLINDASTDDTLAQLFGLQKKFGKTWIRVVSLPQNRGPAAARNAAWNLSGQTYLAFLDADDSWHPEKVDIQYRWMKNRPDVWVTSHRCIQLGGLDPYPELSGNFAACALKPLGLLIRNRMLTRSVMLLRTLPFRFPEDKRFSEDYYLWLEMVLNGVNAWYLDSPLAASYKSAYGEGGLSRDLTAMERGELDTYKRLSRKKLLPAGWTIALFGFSLVKHMRRAIIHRIKGTYEL